MKYEILKLGIIVCFITLIGACSDQSLNNKIETPDETGVDSLILALRSYKDFPVIEVDINELELLLNTNQNSAISKSNSSNTPSISDAVYLVNTKIIETTTAYNSLYNVTNVPLVNYYPVANVVTSNYDHFYVGQANKIAVGFAGHSGHEDLTFCGVWFREMGLDGHLSPSIYSLGLERTNGVAGNGNTLTTFSGKQVSIIEGIQNRVMIGMGVRVGTNSITTGWLYTAPYDPTTGYINVTDVNDIHIVIAKGGINPNGPMEMVIRTFDAINTMQGLQQTFVNGWGGRVANGSFKRLMISTIQLQNY